MNMSHIATVAEWVRRALRAARPSEPSRDAIHAVLMERNDVSRILTFDAAFDQVPGIQRLA